MLTILIFGGLAAVLFAASLITKRRFGVLGLALAAGAILAPIWTDDASLLVAITGIVPDGAWSTAVTTSLVILAPAIVLLFHGSTYKTVIPRIVGSFLFAGLALAFLATPLSQALTPDGAGVQLLQLLNDNSKLVISLGLIIAVADLFVTKAHKHEEKKHKR